jgi:DNA-binding MarR family transcriptional regulator
MEAEKAATEMRGDCLAVRVRVLNRTITRIYDSAVRRHGLTVPQLNLLSAIQGAGPARSGDVAAGLSMEISTLSRNARIMEREGWISVERAERGNGRLLNLTAAGERKIAEAAPAWRRAQAEARALLGEEGARTIKRVVDGLWADRPSGT